MIRGGVKKFLRQIKKTTKFDEIMGMILWIKILKRGWKNECTGAWETEDLFLALRAVYKMWIHVIRCNLMNEKNEKLSWLKETKKYWIQAF